MTGSLETKYRWTEYGLTFTEKWNTDNTLGTEITVEDQVRCPEETGIWEHTPTLLSGPYTHYPISFPQLARGLKLTFDSSFSPNTG